MSLPPLASLPQFAARLPEELEQADGAMERAAALLDDASAIVRLESGREWATWALDEDDEETSTIEWAEYDDVLNAAVARQVVAQITMAAAMRAYENPEGVESETILGYSSKTSKLTASNSVWLLDSEKSALGRLFGASQLASVTLQRPAGELLRGDPAGRFLDVDGYPEAEPIMWLPSDEG